jgi:hypothetical protein
MKIKLDVFSGFNQDSCPIEYRSADNSRQVSFNVSAWEWVYATNLSRLLRETRDKQTARGRSTHCTNNSDPITSTSELLRQNSVSACSPILGSPTCVWPLRNRDPPAKICLQTFTGSWLRPDSWHFTLRNTDLSKIYKFELKLFSVWCILNKMQGQMIRLYNCPYAIYFHDISEKTLNANLSAYRDITSDMSDTSVTCFHSRVYKCFNLCLIERDCTACNTAYKLILPQGVIKHL